jgi:hypothetical protein
VSDLTNLQALKSNLIAALANESAYQVSYGAKPSYQIDGEQVQWTEYRDRMIDKIETLNKLIQVEGGPFELRTQGVS